MIVVVDMTDGKSFCFAKLLQTLKIYQESFRIVKTIQDIQKISSPDINGIIISGSQLRLTTTTGSQTHTTVHIDDIQLPMYCILTFKVPILGICFGCQLLNYIHGGKLKPFGREVCESHSKLHFCFNDVISKVAPGFQVHRKVKVDGKQVICHISKDNMTGLLFHPEADLDKSGELASFLQRCKQMFQNKN